MRKAKAADAWPRSIMEGDSRQPDATNCLLTFPEAKTLCVCVFQENK